MVASSAGIAGHIIRVSFSLLRPALPITVNIHANRVDCLCATALAECVDVLVGKVLVCACEAVCLVVDRLLIRFNPRLFLPESFV